MGLSSSEEEHFVLPLGCIIMSWIRESNQFSGIDIDYVKMSKCK